MIIFCEEGKGKSNLLEKVWKGIWPGCLHSNGGGTTDCVKPMSKLAENIANFAAFIFQNTLK